jgi:hypothetical protein
MVNDVAMYNGMTEAQLLVAMGVAPEIQSSGNRFPLLKINYEDEDAEGNTLRKGTFSYPTEQGTVYCKSAKLRAFADYLQYLDYDPEQNSVVNKTIIHRPGDEPIDEKGGIRCGKPASKALREMDDDQKKLYKNITCFRYLFGKVTLVDAKTSDGTSVTVEDAPCLFRIKGASFLTFSDQVLEPCRNQKVKFPQVVNDLNTERHKKGTVTYFTASFTPDFSNILQLQVHDMEFMSMILDIVNAENTQVIAKYNEALRNKQTSTHDSAIVDEVESYLDADFEEVS